MRQSQPATVLRHLKRYRWLSSYEAWHRWGITRLADVIHKLKGRGISIETQLVKHNGSRYAKYNLAK